MKLRTKILWISSLALVMASLMTGILILRVSVSNMKNAAISENYQLFYAMIDEFEQMLTENVSSETRDVYIGYFFKRRRDEINICFQKTEDADGQNTYVSIYNHTTLSAEQLQELDYRDISTYSISYSEYLQDGQDYIVFLKELRNGLLIYQLVSLEKINDSVGQMRSYMIGIILAVTALMAGVLFVVLRHLLMPLRELNATTKRMAEGDYGQRIAVRRRDELGQLEDSFNKMAEAVEVSVRNLEESEKKKTLFMGNLTHELKTPMTAISGYAQTLLSTRLSRENQEAALYYIYQECTRLERLSKKMMKLLELDQDSDIVLVDTPVEKIFQAAAQSCEIILKEKQMTLECIHHGEHFLMDADLMTDLLINLIDNGIKASDNGSKIILQAEENCIKIQDFGRGIPWEEQEKILEPFYMVDKSRSRKNGGAGLGLALSALIAKKHHITMSIESKEGEGTLINLQFV